MANLREVAEGEERGGRLTDDKSTAISDPQGIAAMKDILREVTPDAIFCSNDYMAAGAMKVLAESKLRVPEDVVIVGYDNTDICIGLSPP